MKVNFSEIAISFIERLASRIETARELRRFISRSLIVYDYSSSHLYSTQLSLPLILRPRVISNPAMLKALVIRLLV